MNYDEMPDYNSTGPYKQFFEIFEGTYDGAFLLSVDDFSQKREEERRVFCKLRATTLLGLNIILDLYDKLPMDIKSQKNPSELARKATLLLGSRRVTF